MLSVAGCGSTTDPGSESTGDTTTSQSTEAGAEKTVHKIGWSCHYWNAYNTSLDKYMNDFFSQFDDVELITTDANNDALKQVSDIEDLIEQGCEVIICKPQDDITIANVMAEARAKGILFILIQREVRTDEYDYFFGADMFDLGYQMGENIIKEGFPEGNFNYLQLEGAAAGTADIDSTNGIMQAFEDSGLPNIVKLDGQNNDAARADTKPIVEDWLTAHGEAIDVITAANDESMIGAIQAIQESGIEKDIWLSSLNCVAEVIPYIQDGTLKQSFAYNCGIFPACEVALAYVRGQDISDVKRDYFFPAMAIDKENLDVFAEAVEESGLYMFNNLPPTSDNVLYEKIIQDAPELERFLWDNNENLK